jgi:NADPH:quinone reductase
MTQAILLRAHSDAHVLKAETIDDQRPGTGEIRIRQTAIGVNFHDVYVRNGSYRTLQLPGVPGIEAVGIVEDVGAGVSSYAAGDRIGYVTGGYGAYAQARNLPAELAIPLPATIDDRQAASVLLKGMTAEMLLRRVHRVEAGMTILVHAAAGGVGRLLCQWAAHLGATVIGTVGSARKATLAKASGCHHTILYREVDFTAKIAELTEGRGVDVAYDSVGRDTFDGSLSSLAPLGHLVNFGQASGPVAPFEVGRLAARSNTLTRPIIFHYLADRDRRKAMTASLFAVLEAGIVKTPECEVFDLSQAAAAHERLESRQAEGAVLLVPQGGGT